jgi:IS5 family transposase
LTSYIKWDALEKEFSPYFEKEDGKPAKPVRLITGIMILQHMYKLSDEAVVARWVEILTGSCFVARIISSGNFLFIPPL